MNHIPPVLVTSDYGWIGNICWSNSHTMPHRSIFARRTVTYWGGFGLLPHNPRRPFGQEIEFKAG